MRFDRPVIVVEDPDLVEEAKARIALTLVIIDTAILVCSGLLGYFLAGRTLEPIKKMLDDQTRFVSDASHEFKTPLTALKSSFEVFLRDKKADINEARTLIKDGIDDVDRLNSLATSLLDLARFQQPDHKTAFVVAELDVILEKAVENIQPFAKKADIEIHFQKSNLKVIGDRGKLVQLFTILLDNAVKYSKPNSKVDITANLSDNRVENKYAQVKVIDYGIGIAKEDLPHIFDRFYRADLSRSKERIDGYGLGLPIAKNIVESHGGKISVGSELGKGTTFQVILRIDD
jgi:signal transduction histidine kinase